MLMQMTALILIIYALKALTLVWPLATEILALLWWPAAADPSTLPTFIIVTVYLAIVFAPRVVLTSLWGAGCVMLLLGASLYLLLRYWSDPSGVPQMIWTHLGFGATWLAVLAAERLVRKWGPGT